MYQANRDRHTAKMIKFGVPVRAKVLRIYPQTWHGGISLRL